MDALAISAANLDTIEKNLGAVANELTGVMSNVSSVNSQVNNMEEKVNSLNDEVKSLIKEIRETTIVTNARQNIMYNNEEIEKKYGYYNQVRRTTESVINAILTSNLSFNSLKNLKEQLLLNNPNYWLTHSLSALVSWILDDKETTYQELDNSLRKDEEKTCLFFTLINLKLNRINTSINWLNKYLSLCDPSNLNKDFITILDLVSTGSFGSYAKDIVISKITNWFNKLNALKEIQNKSINTWIKYIKSEEETIIKMPALEIHSTDTPILKENIIITSSYHNVLDYLNKILTTPKKPKNVNDILHDLIYKFESKEQVYEKDNLMNSLLIKCNGNKAEAEKLFKQQSEVYDTKQDLITILNNIIINKDLYEVSNETYKIALCLVKDYIIKAYEEINKKINKQPFNINVNGFTTTTQDGTNIKNVNNDLDLYADNKFINDDKDLLGILLFINIFGVVGISLTLKIIPLTIIIGLILIIGDYILISKLNKRNKLRLNEKLKYKEDTKYKLERVLAEVTDYNNMLNEDYESLNNLYNLLNTLNINTYMHKDGERNIQVGGES